MDVVVAPATPWGRSALAVVRLSGDGAHDVCAAIARPRRPGPLRAGVARRVDFHDAEGVFDDGVAVLGRAPRTYTGEDTVELSCHGNPVVVERLIAAALAAGARLAGPGELTRRAVVHGKLDLVEAEAVLQVAEAETAAGLDVARAALDGRVHRFLDAIRAALLDAGSELEARLDYPADELALDSDGALVERLHEVARRCEAAAATEAAGRVLVHGARVALVGAVNAGKSSLFNALLGRPRALVHDLPGTTRDVVEARAVIDGVAVTLLDTAGERDTDDPVEAAGLALARELVADADLLLVVLRAGEAAGEPVEATILARTATGTRRLVVYNGVDRPHAPPPVAAIAVSARTGEGIAALRTAIRAALVGGSVADGRLVIASARQRDLLLLLAARAREAADALPTHGVAVASELVLDGLAALAELTGADVREEVLDTLFARFCIGK